MQTGSHAPLINMTPLIDVLLVLLIIFMVIVPTTPVGLRAQVPHDAASPVTAGPSPIVVTVRADGTARLNQQSLGTDEWPERLREALALRGDKTVFFRAEPDLEFRHVASAIDEARGVGAGAVGLLPR